MNIPVVSLTRYLLDHEGNNPGLGVEFCHLMVQLAFAVKIMAREITLAPLVLESGLAGERNASGDIQKALDVFTNNDGRGLCWYGSRRRNLLRRNGSTPGSTGRHQREIHPMHRPARRLG
jgi:Fructose-1-6-bisphosphatase, N-terminal domain